VPRHQLGGDPRGCPHPVQLHRRAPKSRGSGGFSSEPRVPTTNEGARGHLKKGKFTYGKELCLLVDGRAKTSHEER
jgi:hypothetical protein